MKKIQGFVLFIVAAIMAMVLIPALFILGLILAKNRNDYMFFNALSIDQTGNTIGAPVFNKWLVKEKVYQFGDPDDTISYVLGKNEAVSNLTKLGKGIVWILNFIDPGHTQMAVLRAIKIKKQKLLKK
jgi:hypothetical protein